MTLFTKIYRMLWFFMIFLIIFFDRNNSVQSWITILFLLFLTTISVLRFIESRNEWRKIINEESLDKDVL
jgi:multisubunit Na+/H+ antiporter MnhF subunit